MTQHQRILKYLDKCDPAVSGQHGHATTFRVACKLWNGFALPEPEALRYLGIYNQKCLPPWKPHELKHKVKQAAKSTHTKPRGHLIQGASCRQPKPIKIIPALAKITCQMPKVVKLAISRTVRTITFNTLRVREEKEIKNIYIRYRKQPSEASEPLASRIPPGLCSICWDHAGKYIPLNEAGVCPRVSTFWHVNYAL